MSGGYVYIGDRGRGDMKVTRCSGDEWRVGWGGGGGEERVG